jgi:hypothetical protein
MPIVPTHGTDQRCRILSQQLIGWNRLPLPHLIEKSAVARLVSIRSDWCPGCAIASLLTGRRVRILPRYWPRDADCS